MIRHVGSNMETVRNNNRSMIAKYINDNGPSSRKEISQATGLTAAAVTQICGNMIQEGILEETGLHAESNGVGRRRVLLDLAYAAFCVIAVNIDSEKTVIALSDLKGSVISRKILDHDSYIPAENFLKTVALECIAMTNADPLPSRKIAAVGVSVPGMVDSDQGISIRAYGVWNEEVRIREILESYLPYPVFVEKNVNALAAAEQYYGIGKDYNHLMLIKWGPGVGCAMIIDRKIYEGRHNRAAELGHFIVEPGGNLCSCGKRGCLETRISYSALQKIARFEVAEFGEKLNQSEKIQEAIDLFARSIVNSATIMAPDRVVLTGSLFQDERVRTRLIECCERYDSAFHERRIVYSSLAEMSDYIGPVATCAENLFFKMK